MLFVLFSMLLARGTVYMYLAGLYCLLFSLGCWLGGEFYMYLIGSLCRLLCSLGCWLGGEFYMHLVGLCCLLCFLGCWLGGEFYLIGQRWSPVIEPYGLMICVKCQCASVRMFNTYFIWFKLFSSE